MVPRNFDSGEVVKKRRAWEENRSIPHAIDLIGSAIVVGAPEAGLDAADFIAKSNAPEPARRLALACYRFSDRPEPYQIAEEGQKHFDGSIATIGNLKSSLRRTPRNPFGWVDLSLEYVNLGQRAKSKHAMDVAHALAPNNRYVLRSFARLYVHLGDPQKAHDLLRKSELSKLDPWLASAEIAAATVAARPIRMFKQAKSLISSGNHAYFDLAELSAAVATLELAAGKQKAARQYFEASLVDPTENSVAQASWAARKGNILVKPIPYNHITKSGEAQTWKLHKAKQWKSAVQASRRWLADEPFSARPAVHGAYLASTFLLDYEQSVELSKLGLSANPADTTLLNNLAFSLAKTGQVGRAFEQIKKIDLPNTKDWERICVTATLGLISYRNGHLELGREFYMKSRELARKSKMKNAEALAAINMADEEKNLNTERAQEIFNEAKELCDKSTIFGIEDLVSRIEKRK